MTMVAVHASGRFFLFFISILMVRQNFAKLYNHGPRRQSHIVVQHGGRGRGMSARNVGRT
jgi:hypothetical protein